MTKRLICIFLTITMFLSICTVNAANVVEKKEVPEFLKAFDFITAEEAEKNSDESLTRGEFSIIAGKLFQRISFYENDDSGMPFSDVSPERADFAYIKLLADHECVSGYSDYTFRPDEKIETEHAAYIILKVMGYSEKYMSAIGFNALSQSKGIFDNVSRGKYLTWNSAFSLIYNALTADVGDLIYPYNNDNTNKSATILADKLKVYFVSGIVTDDGVTSYTGKTKTIKGNVIINDEVFDITAVNKTPEIGTFIKGYYIEEDNEKILKYYYTDEKKNQMVTFDADDIDSFDGSYVYEVYKDKDSYSTVKRTLDKSYKLIYNGVALVVDKEISSEEFIRMMKPQHGSIKLIDNNNDSKYDIAIITNYKLMVVGGVDRSSKTIHDKRDISDTLELEKINDYTIYDIEDAMREMAFERIVVNNIIYAAVSYDFSSAEILVSSKNVSGKVSGINDDEIKIDGEAYTLTEEVKDLNDWKNIQNMPVAIFYLTPDNKVAYFEYKGTDDTHFVYLYKCMQLEEDEDVIALKVYTDTNEYKTVKLAKNVKVDGRKFGKKNVDALYLYLTSHRYGIGSLAAVKYNSAGEINYIDLAYNEEDNDFDCFDMPYGYPHSNESKDSLHIARGILGYKSASDYKDSTKFNQINVTAEMLGSSQLAMTVDTSVFNIPIDGGAEDCFVTHVTDFADGSNNTQSYSITAYALKKDSLYADAVTINDKKCANIDLDNYNSAGISPKYIVTEIFECLNEMDEPVTKLKVYNYLKKNFYDLYTSTDTAAKQAYYGVDENGKQVYKAVEVGDIIMVGKDKFGTIPDGQIRIMYSPSANPDKVAYRNHSWNTANETITAKKLAYGVNIGWINKIDGGFIELSCVDPLTVRKIDYDNLIVVKNGTIDYWFYENGKVSKGDATQLVSYEQTTSKDCKAVMIVAGTIGLLYSIKN